MPESDIPRAMKTLLDKTKAYRKLFDYYEGRALLPLVSERMREVYDQLNLKMSENWCEVVVGATFDRITLTEFKGSTDAITTELKNIVLETGLLLEANELHRTALIAGESYLIAWKLDEPRVTASGLLSDLECVANDPRMCHVFYSGENPNEKQLGCKWWDEGEGEDGRSWLTLYYADHLEYYTADTALDRVTSPDAWLPDTERGEGGYAENPFNQIPIFHFRPQLRRAASDLANVIPIQDATNLSVSNMIIGGEFAALPQKYVISSMEIGSQLRNAPNIVWDLPVGDGQGQGTTVGQFAPADFSNFLRVIDHFITSLAVISRTPKHYFMLTGSDLSGEALMTLEAPNVKKAQDRIDQFIPIWLQVAAFLLLLRRGAAVTPDELRNLAPVFRDPATVQPLTTAQIDQTRATTQTLKAQFGVSEPQLQRELGYTEPQITQMATEKQAQVEQSIAQNQAAFTPGGAP